MSVEVEFLDIGQGDSTFMRLANGKTVLIDCHFSGNYEDRLDHVVDQLEEDTDGNRVLDLLIITHPHEDHIGGIGELGRRVLVQEVWESGHRLFVPKNRQHEYPHYYDMLALLQQVKLRGGRVRELRANRRPIPDGPDPESLWYCLCPTTAYSEQERPSREQVHSRCLVVRFEYCGTSILFTGDASWRAYAELIVPVYGELLPCDVLQASHHGSITFFADTDEGDPYVEHIKRIAPDITIISVGDNSHGHPHPTAVDLYDEHTYHYSKGSGQVFRTDEVGSVAAVLSEDGTYTTMPTYHCEAMTPKFRLASFRIDPDPGPDWDGTYARGVYVTFHLRLVRKAGGADVGQVRWEVQNNGVGRDHRVHDWYVGESDGMKYRNHTKFNGTHNLYVVVRSQRGHVMAEMVYSVCVRDEG